MSVYIPDRNKNGVYRLRLVVWMTRIQYQCVTEHARIALKTTRMNGKKENIREYIVRIRSYSKNESFVMSANDEWHIIIKLSILEDAS